MSDALQQVLSVIGCLAVSSFAAASETALIALGELRARQLADDGHGLLKLWNRHPERVLATLLITNNLANTLSAALVTSLLTRLEYPHVVAVSTGLVTLLILVFGDITPKALAREYAPQFTAVAMPVVVLLYYALYPAVIALSWVPRRIHGFLRRGETAEQKETKQSVTSKEIEYMIDLGVKQGVLDRDRSELLTSVLEFADIVTREVMVPRMKVVAIPVDATKEQVLKVIVESEHSRIPVFQGSIDEVVGVLYVKAFLAELETGSSAARFDIRRYMRPPFFVPELMKISRLLREFQKRKNHLAIVVDEFGGTAGVVALEDVVEEIVGEIQDELDVEEGRVRLLADGTIIADASITLRDLEPDLQVDFPDELDADSLGGFLTATAGRVPPVGSVLLWGGLRFTVRAADERRVTRVEIARVRDATAPDGEVIPAPAHVPPPAERRTESSDGRTTAGSD